MSGCVHLPTSSPTDPSSQGSAAEAVAFKLELGLGLEPKMYEKHVTAIPLITSSTPQPITALLLHYYYIIVTQSDRILINIEYANFRNKKHKKLRFSL